MSEEVLISLATGDRPRTAEVALKALSLAVAHLKTFRPTVTHVEVHVGAWDDKPPLFVPVADEVNVFFLRHGVKPEILNHSLTLFQQKRVEKDLVETLPDWWFTMDDDIVLGAKTMVELIELAELAPEVGLWGAWNDESERTPPRGVVRQIEGMDHDVQFDNAGHPFCVGGALHLVPRATVKRVGTYADDHPRHEDAEYTDRVRSAGMRAVLVKTLPVTVLPDDGVIEGYRDRIKAMHYGGWDPRANRRAENADRLRGADEGPSGSDDESAEGIAVAAAG